MRNSDYEQILNNAISEYERARSEKQKATAINNLHNVAIMVGRFNYSSYAMKKVYDILRT